MVAAARRSARPAPPPRQAGPIIYGSSSIQHWLIHYWQKLELPAQELNRVAITQDRQEYMHWTGKRLNIMVLGCYCYLPAPPTTRPRKHGSLQALPALNSDGASQQHVPGHRHLIFIEPDMQPRSIEVTVAHELIHLADRYNGTPRRHRHHGYDSIAADEPPATGYSLEKLRHLLPEQSQLRYAHRPSRRPIPYLYPFPRSGKEYP